MVNCSPEKVVNFKKWSNFGVLLAVQAQSLYEATFPPPKKAVALVHLLYKAITESTFENVG